MTGIVETPAAFTGRTSAWGHVGVALDRNMTVPEALEASHLAGWNVRKVGPLQATELSADGVTTIDAPDTFMTVRTDPATGRAHYIGTVGRVFQPFQNEEMGELLQAVLDESGAFVESAGHDPKHKRVFLAAKLPNTMLIGGVDKVDTRMVIMQGHAGDLALRMTAAPCRIACTNQLNAIRVAGRAQSWTRKHTHTTKDGVAKIREDLQLTFAFNEAFEVEAERMIQEAMTVDAFDERTTRIFKLAILDSDSDRVKANKARVRDDLRGLFQASPTMTGITGTRWAGYNAVTEYVDHFAKTKQADPAKAALVRAWSAVDGEGVTKKERAFELFRVPA